MLLFKRDSYRLLLIFQEYLSNPLLKLWASITCGQDVSVLYYHFYLDLLFGSIFFFLKQNICFHCWNKSFNSFLFFISIAYQVVFFLQHTYTYLTAQLSFTYLQICYLMSINHHFLSSNNKPQVFQSLLTFQALQCSSYSHFSSVDTFVVQTQTDHSIPFLPLQF